MPDSLVTSLALTYTISGQTVNATFQWNRSDPLFIETTFHQTEEYGGDTRWLISRDLLTDALKGGEAGTGDVRVWLDNGWLGPVLVLRFANREISAELTTEMEPVIRFLTSTYEAVPRGEEVIDVDALIKGLNL
jgi:Streptomyces sporulation and cell division protein, SsgA